ncbi:MAG: TRAP transporter substrate-binding protein DctP [Ilumatobacteraceae bacterium]
MRRNTIGIAVGVMLVAVGCGSDSPTKAGGESAPITLNAVTTIGPGFPAGDQLVDFARRVSDLSAGGITIDILDTVAGATEREIVESVQAGKADLGLVAARVFDTLGVTSMRALQAPFLIDRNALADAVLADPMAGEMLAGLDGIGLTGLTLAFDSLRQPMGTPDPLLEPADFAGAVIDVLPSVTQQSVYEAFGAKITEVVDAEMTIGIHEGKIQGRDGATQVVPGATLGPVTGNAVLGLKANALFVDSKRFDGLMPKQQDVLRRAAAGTRDRAATQHASLAEAARDYCAASHGDVVLATDQQLAALRTAAEPVYTELNKDEFTRQAIERIAALKEKVPAQPAVSACTSAASGATTSAAAAATTIATSTDDQSALDGIWRYEITLDPNADRPDAARQASLNNGTFTVELNNGHSLSIENSGNRHFGTYSIRGDHIGGVDDDGVKWDFVFHRNGDTMTWTPVPSGDPVEDELDAAAWANPMQRIGDPTIEPGNQGTTP